MLQHECTLVGNAQVPAQCQCALALHFVAEDRDGGEVALQGQLVRCEQRAAGNGEILAASRAAEAVGASAAAALIGAAIFECAAATSSGWTLKRRRIALCPSVRR